MPAIHRSHGAAEAGVVARRPARSSKRLNTSGSGIAIVTTSVASIQTSVRTGCSGASSASWVIS